MVYVSATLVSGAFSNYAQLCNYDATKDLKSKPCDNSTIQPDDDSVS